MSDELMDPEAMGDKTRGREVNSDWLRDQRVADSHELPHSQDADMPMAARDADPPREGRMTVRLGRSSITRPSTKRHAVRTEDLGDGEIGLTFDQDDASVTGGWFYPFDGGERRRVPLEQIEGWLADGRISQDEIAEQRALAFGYGLDDLDIQTGDEADASVSPLGTMSYGSLPARRPPAPSSGSWAFDSRRDVSTTGSPDAGRYARRVGAKAFWRVWDRVGPLLFLGVGWLWGRAQVAGAAAVDRWPGRASVLSSRTRQKRTDAMAWLMIGAICLLVLSICSLGLLIGQWKGLLPPQATGAVCCPTSTAEGSSPSDTPGPGTPTATSCSNCGNGGGKQSTPTPGGFCVWPFCPQPTPTPAPNPFAPSATVTFTKTQASASAPATLTVSDGSVDSASGGTTAGKKITVGPMTRGGGSWANAWQVTQQATYSVLSVVYVCHFATTGFQVCSAPSGTRIADQSGRGNDCVTQASVGADTGDGVSRVNCRLIATGPIHASDVNYLFETAPCGTSCSAGWGDASDVSLGQNAQGSYFVPSPCVGDSGASARSNVTAALAGGFSGGLGADAIGQQTQITDNGYCANPASCGVWSSGQNVGGANAYTICASGSAWKLTFSPSGAQTIQRSRITAPAGYIVDATSIQVCGSVTVKSTDPANGWATLSCPATANASYDWGGTPRYNLKSALAGKTATEASDILAATAGVAAGTYTISIPSGYTRLPNDITKITLTIN
jgi:hypothetical protein